MRRLSTNKDLEVCQQLTSIAQRYGLFECVECAQAIKDFLISKAISGKHLKIDLGSQGLPWSVIYDLRRQQQISTNGHHEGIAIVVDGEDLVFDNIDHQGIAKTSWVENLTSPTIELGRGSFVIVEEAF
jgi:hypothetical protein